MSTMVGRHVASQKAFGSMGQQPSVSRDMAMRAAPTVMSMSSGPWDQETVEKLEKASKHQRLVHLEEQAMDAIK